MQQAVDAFVAWLDPVLIAAYRWLDHPLWAWWLGTFVLSMMAAIVGELTLALVYRINRQAAHGYADEATDMQNRSLNAARAGDKKAYKAINRLANDAFGRSFFLSLAMGMGSLWPAFFAAAWLQMRFGDLRWPLPFIDWQANFVPGFIFCYIFSRILVGRVRKLILARLAARRAG